MLVHVLGSAVKMFPFSPVAHIVPVAFLYLLLLSVARGPHLLAGHVSVHLTLGKHGSILLRLTASRRSSPTLSTTSATTPAQACAMITPPNAQPNRVGGLPPLESASSSQGLSSPCALSLLIYTVTRSCCAYTLPPLSHFCGLRSCRCTHILVCLWKLCVRCRLQLLIRHCLRGPNRTAKTFCPPRLAR